MSDVNFRRTWSKESTSSSSSVKKSQVATRAPILTGPPKLLEAREKKVKFDAIVGKTQMVAAGTGASAQAGFYCSLCDKLCKDNVAFLDHLNSSLHARNTGHKMEIKRATVESVLARIEYHKRKRLEEKEEYDLEKRVKLLKEQSELEKQRKKQLKKEAKLKRATRRSREEDDENEEEEQEEEPESEYSDYEIDEFGNIIETPKPIEKPKKILAQKIKEDDLNEPLAEMMGFYSFGSTRK